MFKHKQSFAINLSDYSIEALELHRERGTLSIKSYNRVLLDSGVVEDGKIIQPEKLKISVAKLLNEAKPQALTTREVIVALPESKVFAQSFELEKNINPKQVPAALFAQAREVIPIDVESMSADFIETARGNDLVEYLFVATYRTLIKEYTEFFERVGLKVTLVTMESLALGAAVIDPKDEVDTLVLDIGSRTTIASIFYKGELKETININVAGNSITKALAEKLEIDFKEAEKIKKTLGLNSKDSDGKEMLIIQGQLQPLKDELLLFTKYYQGKSGRAIGKVLMTGGSSSLAGITEYFESNLGVAVTVAQPLPIFEAASTESFSPTYLVVLGLSAIAIGERPHIVNFILRTAKDWQTGKNISQPKPIPGTEHVRADTPEARKKRRISVLAIIFIIAVIALAITWWIKSLPSAPPVNPGLSFSERVEKTFDLVVKPFTVEDDQSNIKTLTFSFVITLGDDTNELSGSFLGEIDNNTITEVMPFDTATVDYVKRINNLSDDIELNGAEFKVVFDEFLAHRLWETKYDTINEQFDSQGQIVLPSYKQLRVRRSEWAIPNEDDIGVQTADLQVEYEYVSILDKELFLAFEKNFTDSFENANRELIFSNATFDLKQENDTDIYVIGLYNYKK